MSGSRQNSRKGSSPLIALLILAISSTMTAGIGMAVLKLVEETMPQESIPVIVTQREAAVEILNTASFSIKLSSLGIYINDRAAAVADADGDGWWEPNEKLTIDFGQLDDVSVISVYYENQLVYKAVYFKPISLHHDQKFPEITYRKSGMSYTLEISDDTSIVAVNIYVGHKDGEDLAFGFSPLSPGDVEKLKKCYEDYRRTGKWTCDVKRADFTLSWDESDENSTQLMLNYKGHVHSAKRNNTLYFARIETFDITGKSSSIVLALDSPPKVTLVSPQNNAKFVVTNQTDRVNILISAIASDDFKVDRIELFMNGNLLKTCHAEQCSINVPTGPGRYTVMAKAHDSSGQISTDSVSFEVELDELPFVEITSPREGEKITGKDEPVTFTIAARAGDDFGLNLIEVYLDYEKIKSYQLRGEKNYSFSFTHSAGAGKHKLEVVAYDIGGKSSTARVEFTISVPFARITGVYVPEVDWSNSVPTSVTQPR